MTHRYKPFLEDETQFSPSGGVDKKMQKVCQYLEGLCTEMRYYQTNFPRIPMKVEQDFKVQFFMLEKKRKRAKNNAHMKKYLVHGTRVKAEWSEDNNWYDAVIEECLANDWFLVTFTEYGNQEEVDIGCIALFDEDDNIENIGSDGKARHSRDRSDSRSKKDRSSSRTRDRERGSRSSSRNRDMKRSRSGSADRDREGSSKKSDAPQSIKEIQAEIRRREMEKATVSSGRSYATRPPPYKTSLSNVAIGKTDRPTVRARSRTPLGRRWPRKPSPPRERSPTPIPVRAPVKKAETNHADQLAKFKLKAQYGDQTKLASSSYASSAKYGGKTESTDVIRLGFLG
jgi:hypothetical protein